jgi:hypothetical protein
MKTGKPDWGPNLLMKLLRLSNERSISLCCTCVCASIRKSIASWPAVFRIASFTSPEKMLWSCLPFSMRHGTTATGSIAYEPPMNTHVHKSSEGMTDNSAVMCSRFIEVNRWVPAPITWAIPDRDGRTHERRTSTSTGGLIV